MRLSKVSPAVVMGGIVGRADGQTGRVDERLRLAVEDNIGWCDRVARRYGVVTSLDEDRWWAASRTPPFYPDAITRRPTTGADAVLSGVDAGPGCSVKDSFATLDLRPSGFEVLLEAQWLFLGPTDRTDVVGLVDIDGDVELAWREAAAPGRPVVGYEHGAALAAAQAAGAVPLGPLRVWLRPD
jgi:hypothetical protein